MDPQAASPVVVAGGSKLRYPLRSASKSRESKPAMADARSSTVSRRTRPMSSVSKSVNVFDLSGNTKSLKPPRRFSGPSKSNLSPMAPTIGSITPISEARSNRSSNQGASGTPVSDVSRSSARRKFCVLSSVSYWLTQIKLSEAASKHSVSLSFFKLALECGCEPNERLQEELKSYSLKYNLVSELGEYAEEVLQSYNILDDLRQVKVSGTSQSSQKDAQIHEDDAGKLGSLKPKSLNSESFTTKETSTKKQSANKNKAPVGKPSISSHIKSQKPIQAELGNKKSNAKTSTRKTTSENVNSLKLLADNAASETEESAHDDKENMVVVTMERPEIEVVAQT